MKRVNILPQEEEFKYLGVLFTSGGKMARETGVWRDAGSVPVRRGEAGA